MVYACNSSWGPPKGRHIAQSFCYTTYTQHAYEYSGAALCMAYTWGQCSSLFIQFKLRNGDSPIPRPFQSIISNLSCMSNLISDVGYIPTFSKKKKKQTQEQSKNLKLNEFSSVVFRIFCRMCVCVYAWSFFNLTVGSPHMDVKYFISSPCMQVKRFHNMLYRYMISVNQSVGLLPLKLSFLVRLWRWHCCRRINEM